MKNIILKYGLKDLILKPFQNKKLQEGRYFKSVRTGEVLLATNYMYLVFKEEKKNVFFDYIKSKYCAKVEETLDNLSFILEFPQNCTVLLAELFQRHSFVQIAEPNFRKIPDDYEFELPTDDLLDAQWYIKNDGKDKQGDNHWQYRKGADAKIIEAWKLLHSVTGELGSDTVTIAVLDKGFARNHPDFQGKVVADKDFSPTGESQPFRIFMKGVHHENPNIIYTTADHGTACAGIACANANGVGIVGVAPNSKLMPIIYNTAGGHDLRRMFRHIMENGGDVISCSFGNYGIPMDSLAIRTIKECATQGRNGKGCVIVFATGNDGRFLHSGEMATHPNVIAVGASTSEDTFAPYTNRTMNMSVVAPGGYGFTGTMVTTDVGHFFQNGVLVAGGQGPIPDGRNPFDETQHFYRFNAEGTSFACPVVAGVAALMLSANPNLTAAEVKQIIEETADKIGDPSEYSQGHSPKYGYGRINAANAVRRAFNIQTVLSSPSEKPDYSFVPELKHDFGVNIHDELGVNDFSFTYKIRVGIEQLGKTAIFSLDVPVDHNPFNALALYIRHGSAPNLLQNQVDAQGQLNEEMMTEIKVENLQLGDYYLMIKCFSPQMDDIPNGGKFTINIAALQDVNSPNTVTLGLDSNDISKLPNHIA